MLSGRPRKRMSTSTSAMSDLLSTSTSTSDAPGTSASTSRTARSGPLGLGGRVYYVQNEVSVRDLLERRREGRDQLVRKVAHKSNGVRHSELATVWGLRPANRGVERGEQCVLHEHASLGNAIQQRRLPAFV